MSNSKWFVIVNPTSGNGDSKKQWPKIKQHLTDEGFNFDFTFTKSGSHNVDLIKEIVEQGFHKLICVGGDGTIHNTVNGIMCLDENKRSKLKIGVIPIGTGNDWIKTYDIPKKFKEAISIIKTEKTVKQDIGKITLKEKQNTPVYFNNLAGIGFDGYIVSKVGKYKHFGSAAYILGAIMGLFSFKNFKVDVITPHETFSNNSLMVLVGLCNYSGGGMQLTKTPDPTDGLFDVSIAENFNKWDILSNIIKLFNGKIVDYKKVKTLKISKLSIKTSSSPFVQADGELIGKGSFDVELIPEAINFIIK